MALEDEVQQAVLPLTTRARSAAELNALADALDALATKIRRRADATARSGAILRAAQLDAAPRRGGRPRGTGAEFVRLESASSGSIRLLIGKRLYQLIGEPRRVDLQRLGTQIVIRGCAGEHGYAVSAGASTTPKISVGVSIAELLGLTPGAVYPARVQGDAIVID